MAAHLDIRTLGSFDVLRGGEPIPHKQWGTHRAKNLFKLLLSAHGAPLSKDQIIESLWPDTSLKAAQRDIYIAVSELRKLLEPGLRKPADSSFVLSTDSGYRFNPDSHHTTDVALFEQLLASARGHAEANALEAAASAYHQADACYKGEYLPEDIYADWTTRERERLRLLHINALQESADALARLGKFRQAITRCRRALELDNCLEPAYRALMMYHYAGGDRAQALRVYAECQAVLRQELGVPPSQVTSALAAKIQTAQADADPTPYPEPASPVGPAVLDQPPFVGRAREAALLSARLADARAGRGGLVIVAGEPGMGKSRLIAQAMRDAPCLRVQSHELTQGIPFHGIGEALRQSARAGGMKALPGWCVGQLARLVPELAGGAGEPAETDAAKLLDAVRCWCLALKPGQVILIEDLHAADDSTLECLAYLAPHLVGSGTLIAATARPSQRLASLFARAGREPGIQLILLKPLTDKDVGALLAGLAPNQAGMRSLAARLYKATSGNPLHIATLLASLFETGQLWRDGAGRWQGIATLLAAPTLNQLDEMRAVVAQRVSGLSKTAQRLLTLAAVIEEDLSVDLLRTAYRSTHTDDAVTDEAVLDGVDELLAADLLTAPGAGRIGFRNESFRESVYASLSAPRQEWLHSAVGLLLRGRAPDATARLAHHFSRSDRAELAIPYLLSAAKSAEEVYANYTALGYYEQALGILTRLPAPPGEAAGWRTMRLKAEIGRSGMAYRLGLAEVQRAAVQELSSLARDADGVEQADALIQTSYFLRTVQRNAEVAEILEPLLPRLTGPEYGRQREGAWRCLGYAMDDLGRNADAMRCYSQALEAARELKNEDLQATNLMYLSVTHDHLAQWEEALKAAEEAERLAVAAGDNYGLAVVTHNALELWTDLGLWSRAEAAIDRSSALYAQAQIDRILPIIELSRGYLLFLKGEDDARALAHLQQSLRLAQAQEDKLVECLALQNIGSLAARGRDWPACRSAYEKSIAMMDEIGDVSYQTLFQSELALACLQQGNVQAAEAALARVPGTAASKYTPLLRLAQACLLAAQHKPKPAARKLAEAQTAIQSQAEQISDPDIRASFLNHPNSRLILDTALR